MFFDKVSRFTDTVANRWFLYVNLISEFLYYLLAFTMWMKLLSITWVALSFVCFAYSLQGICRLRIIQFVLNFICFASLLCNFCIIMIYWFHYLICWFAYLIHIIFWLAIVYYIDALLQCVCIWCFSQVINYFPSLADFVSAFIFSLVHNKLPTNV